MELKDFGQLNSEVWQWSQQSAQMMIAKVKLLTNNEKYNYLVNRRKFKFKTFQFGEASKIRQHLFESIKTINKRPFGVVERIMFPFAKHGYFIAVGASRGHHKNTNPRRKIEWYNFVFERRLEQLADIVAQHYGDAAAINASKLGEKELK